MIMTGNVPKSLLGGKNMKKTGKTMAAMMKADKAADRKMTPAMMKKDIAADKKLLAQKTKKKGKK